MSVPKYKYKDRFDIVGADFAVEVLGVFPAGQQRMINLKTNSYKVLLNGVEVDISEDNLELLRKSEKPSKVIEEVVEPFKAEGTNNEEEIMPHNKINIKKLQERFREEFIPELPEKRRGRPPKK